MAHTPTTENGDSLALRPEREDKPLNKPTSLAPVEPIDFMLDLETLAIEPDAVILQIGMIPFPRRVHIEELRLSEKNLNNVAFRVVGSNVADAVESAFSIFDKSQDAAIQPRFLVNLELNSQIVHGRRISQDTVEFWQSQPGDAKAIVFGTAPGNIGHYLFKEDHRPVLEHEAMDGLTVAYRQAEQFNHRLCEGGVDSRGVSCKPRVWCQGTDFDIPKMDMRFREIYGEPIWGHRMPRDLRTTISDAIDAEMIDVAGETALHKASEQFIKGLPHTAYADCMRQIFKLCAIKNLV